jgi:hypothetical protein
MSETVFSVVTSEAALSGEPSDGALSEGSSEAARSSTMLDWPECTLLVLPGEGARRFWRGLVPSSASPPEEEGVGRLDGWKPTEE